jgi:hypothetical protein
MTAALTAPFLVAAAVLFAAGVAKLRSPEVAARALTAPPWAIRSFAAVEALVGIWAVVDPGVVNAATVSTLYALFAGASVPLARRRVPCGCFGEGQEPASPIQSALSGCLVVVAVVSALAQPHGLAWILGQSPLFAALCLAGILGAAYGTVFAYKVLPQLWGAWSVP